MGSFFNSIISPLERMAVHDPLAQGLNLPGSHTVADANRDTPPPTMPYAGIAPTLADAQAGYQNKPTQSQIGAGLNPAPVSAPVSAAVPGTATTQPVVDPHINAMFGGGSPTPAASAYVGAAQPRQATTQPVQPAQRLQQGYGAGGSLYGGGAY